MPDLKQMPANFYLLGMKRSVGVTWASRRVIVVDIPSFWKGPNDSSEERFMKELKSQLHGLGWRIIDSLIDFGAKPRNKRGIYVFLAPA